MLRIGAGATIYDRVKTDDPEAEWNLSYLHPLTGNFEAGGAGLEARWRTRFRLFL